MARSGGDTCLEAMCAFGAKRTCIVVCLRPPPVEVGPNSDVGLNAQRLQVVKSSTPYGSRRKQRILSVGNDTAAGRCALVGRNRAFWEEHHVDAQKSAESNRRWPSSRSRRVGARAETRVGAGYTENIRLGTRLVARWVVLEARGQPAPC